MLMIMRCRGCSELLSNEVRVETDPETGKKYITKHAELIDDVSVSRKTGNTKP